MATEYPIHAETLIDDIKESVSVPVVAATRSTILDDVQTEKIVLVQSFADIDSNLGGTIRIALLKDKDGLPTIDNGDAKFEIFERTANSNKIQLNHRGTTKKIHTQSMGESPLCMDGILIVGEPGRHGERRSTLGCRYSSLRSGDPFVLDVRGPLKPTLTPARLPPARDHGSGEIDVSWSRIQHLIDLAHARLWQQITTFLSDGLLPDSYWKLCHLHDADPQLMSAETIWNHLLVPVVDSSEKVQYRPFREIKSVSLANAEVADNKHELRYHTDGGYLAFDSGMKDWTSRNNSLNSILLKLILRFCLVTIRDGKVKFDIVPPQHLNESSIERIGFGSRFEFVRDVYFANDLKDIIAAECELRIANRRNPLVQIARARCYDDDDKLDDFHSFCASVVWCLTNPKNLTKILTEKVTSGRQFRRLGLLYKSLNWDDFHRDFRPPYRVWGETTGVKEVTEADLLSWAEFTKDDGD